MTTEDRELEGLSSRTIWLCLTCETCTTRCPREIDLAKAMSSLREIAIAQKVKPAGKNILIKERILDYGSKHNCLHNRSVYRSND